MGDDDINFDRHFFGFTQLYPTTPGNSITAEYDMTFTVSRCNILLTPTTASSLSGKGKLGRTWLRHFFSKDLPSSRAMIYDYNSKLSSHGIHTIMDYGREFMEAIKRVRQHKR